MKNKNKIICDLETKIYEEVMKEVYLAQGFPTLKNGVISISSPQQLKRYINKGWK